MNNKQIVFVDSAVADWQILAAGIKPGIEVIAVDRRRDGIEQICETLRDRANIESIHIISHGESGSLLLGKNRLNSDTLETYCNSLKQWFLSSVNSIQNRFEILLYGCSVAAGETGKVFVQKLSELTGANIAASTSSPMAALVLTSATTALLPTIRATPTMVPTSSKISPYSPPLPPAQAASPSREPSTARPALISPCNFSLTLPPAPKVKL